MIIIMALLLVFILDVLFAKSTALGKVVKNPYLGGFLAPNILYIIIIGTLFITDYTHQRVVGIMELITIFSGILHFIIKKYITLHYELYYYNKYEENIYQFLLEHKKVLNCSMEEALKKHNLNIG